MILVLSIGFVQLIPLLTVSLHSLKAVNKVYQEAERYQYKLIHQFELSLERLQDDGVNVEFLITRFQPSIEDKLIEQEQFQKLSIALDTLMVEERLLIHELFFNGKSERILASETGIPNMTIHDRKCNVLRKLKNLIEI